MRRSSLGNYSLLALLCASCAPVAESGGADAAKDAAPSVPDASDGSEGGATPVTTIVSESPLSHQETYAALDRAPSGMMALAWMGYRAEGTAAIGYSFSVDDGESWTSPKEVQTPGHDASDQAVVSDEAGNFYLAWLGIPSHAPEEKYYADKVYVARALAGSTTFDDPVQVSDDSLQLLYDKAWIARTGTGAILVTFNQRPDNLAGSPNAIAAVRTMDGTTWKSLMVATGSGYRNQAYVCGVGSAGRLFLIHRGTEEGYLVLRWSDDGGASWPAGNLTKVVEAPQRIEFGPTCVVRGDDVWILFSRGTPESNKSNWKSSSIQVTHSKNGGKDFDPPVEALDPAGPPYAQRATLALEPSGALDVAYYAGAEDDDPQGTLRFVRSTDDGLSFGSSRVIAAVPFTVERGGPRWFGDYMTVLADPKYLFAGYIDTTKSFGHVAFARRPLP